MKVYKTKIDWWLGILMTFPVIGGIAALVQGAVTGASSALLIGVIALGVYGLLFGALILPMRYSISDDGVRVEAGISFVKVNGKSSSVLISPPDREAFFDELARTSPRHRRDDNRVVAK